MPCVFSLVVNLSVPVQYFVWKDSVFKITCYTGWPKNGTIVALKTLDISQGSVATHLRFGEIFSDSIITHFLLILTVK